MLSYSALRSLRRLTLRALHLLTVLSLLLSWLPAQAATPASSEEDRLSPLALSYADLSPQSSDLPPVTQPLSETLVTPTPLDPISATQPLTATLETPLELAPTVEQAVVIPIAPPAPIPIPVTGGVAEGLGGRVRVAFPAQAADRALNVYIRQPSALPTPSLSGRAFEVIAFDESGQEVESFANPLTLEVRYDEASLTGPEDSLQLRYYDEAMQDWYPIGTQVDAEKNVLRARLDHLTIFDTDYVDWEASRLPSLQPFQTTSFTGAATYSMELWTPPGPGGLQPSLTLSYNSQVVDNIIAAQSQASWVGMGWSLDVGGIERNQNGTPKYTGDDTFSISVSGVDSLLLKGSDGYYHTADETFWRIQYDATNNFWTAWAKDGTKYVFGDTSETRADYPISYECHNFNPIVTETKTWRWALHSVTNIHSQSLIYTYTKSKQTYAPEDCGMGEYKTTIWLYPSEIIYPAGSPYKVVFELANRQDYRPSWTDATSYNFYMKERLQGVRIERLGQTVRRYNFTYNNDNQGVILPSIIWKSNPNVFTLTLLAVQEQGRNGATLPATTFAYSDGLHLTQANNGYGGIVNFTYNSTPWYEVSATNAPETDRARRDKTQQEVGCSAPEYTLKPKSGGSVTCDDRGRQLVQGTAYLTLPERFLQPGAAYRLTIEVIRRGTGTTTVTLGLGDLAILTQTVGSSSFTWLSGYKVLPANASTAKLQVNCTALCWVRNMKWELLTTRYRVTQKTLDDPADNAPAAVFRYRYDEPATNDTTHSAFAGTTHPFFLPYSEFRGHVMTQEIGPEGRVSTTFFHQDDGRKGRTLVSLASWEEFGDDFEAGYNGANWQACSGSSFSVPLNTGDPLDRVNNFLRGDRALRLVGDGSWRCGYRNTAGTLSDGEGLLMQFLVNGSAAQAKLALEAGAYQWGVKVDSDGALKAYNKTGSGEVLLGTLISAANFKRDTWYTLLLLADQETFVTRVWERDNPWLGNGYYAGFQPGLGWRLRLEALNGTLWADALSEGRFYDEKAIQYTVVNPMSFDPPCTGDYCFTGLAIYWARLDADKTATYTPLGPALHATRNWYQYDAYGNRTKKQEAVWNAGLGRWEDYRIEVSGYYPNAGVPYLVGLPGYTNTYRCPAGSINGACLNASLTNSLITSSVWYLYDNRDTYSTPPSVGRLTGQSTLLRYADAQNFSDPRRQDQQFTYDNYGNLASKTIYTGEGTYSLRWQGEPRTTSYAYDSTHHTYLVSETSPLPGMPSTTYTYDYNVGLPATLIGPNGPSTTITVTYDTFGRILSLIRPGDNASHPTLQAIYNDPPVASRLWVELRQRIEGDQYVVWRKYYNGLGQLIQSQTLNAQVWDAGSGAQVSRTLLQDTWYNAYGQVIRQSVPYSSTQTSGYITPTLSIPATLTSYDGLGRTLMVTAPDNTKTKYAYLDLEIQVTDALTHTTSTKFDVWGRTVQVIPPTGPDVSYVYDTKDQLISVTRGGATTSLAYDYAGRKTWMDDPDMGEWSYAYDTLGNLTQQMDARGCITTLSYDQINRLTGKTYTNCPTTAPVTYGYDVGANGWGKRTSMSDGSGSTTWNYDARGQVITETRTITGGLGTFVTAWGYNSAGQMDWMRYPQDNQGNLGERVDYTYHNQLTLNSVLSNFPEAYVLNTYYDAVGRVIERKMGDVGHLITQYQYYPWIIQGGRLQRTNSGMDNGQLDALMDLRYTYDSMGNVLTIQDYKMGSPQTQTFSYDALYRLTSAQASGGVFGNYGPESYTYDAGTGNLWTKAGVTYSYNDADHQHAVTSRSIDGWMYQYDANGNMIYRRLLTDGQEKIYNLAYDAENHLIQISGAVPRTQTYGYDGDGRRILASNGSTTTVYIGNYFEWKGTVADSLRYYYAGTVRIAMRKGSEPPLFLLADHLGSTSKVVDENGQVVPGGLRLYKAWGELRYESGIMLTPYCYTGQYEQFADDNNELYHYGARFYDPELSRWVQPDSIIPSVGEGGNPNAIGYLGDLTYFPLTVDYHEKQFLDQLNTENIRRFQDPDFRLPPVPTNTIAFDRYAYSFGNPIRYVDPGGHFAILAALALIGPVGWVAIGIVAVAAVAYYTMGGPQAVGSSLAQAGEVASNGLKALFARGEYVPPSIHGEAERNAYREAVHRYKQAFGLGATDDVPKWILDKIAELLRRGVKPEDIPYKAPEPPEEDEEMENEE